MSPKHKKTYGLLVLMVVFSSLGNVLLSRGMKETGEIVDFSPGALAAVFIKTFTNGSIWFGILSLLLFFVSYLVLLSWADLSYVQPASAIGYALVAVLGYVMLGEFISATRWMGVLFICAGVALVGGTEPNSPPQLVGEPSEARRGGVGQETESFDQHHSGASIEASPYRARPSGRLPSSAEEGSSSSNQPCG